MTRLYIQWAVIALAAAGIVWAASRYYDRHLVTMTPEAVQGSESGTSAVRVQGLVEGGTLAGDLVSGKATFRLAGEHGTLDVAYDGPPPENLRELKTVVVVGRWDAGRRVFLAQDLALVTNYGFVVGSYLVALLPLAVFIFLMERRVRLLYSEIKQAKLYEPEPTTHVDAR
ncbi:MAG TPA: cytochrome c maturation protein CcmE [Nitrospiria bacterium]|nr:cytochrome c maturation protein CcmE [Nitrospiria bacterium]